GKSALKETTRMTINYTNPSVNYYVEDVEVAVRFYTEHFGFIETFRTPKEGTPDHVEIKLGTLTLGLASQEAGIRDHSLPLGPGGFPRSEVVLWTEDVDAAYAALISQGVPSVSVPHTFLDALRAAWVMD